ncbi:ATP-binding protein [Candidatus Woesearchaeota archaeon]|nr:ATP-binding protein [Candidatus Woesearchaeota archaeon]
MKLPDFLKQIEHNGDIFRGKYESNPFKYVNWGVKEDVQREFQKRFDGKISELEEILCLAGELSLNAEWYGNKNKEGKFVHVNVYFGAKGIVLEVTDEGKGYAYGEKIDAALKGKPYSRDKLLGMEDPGPDCGLHSLVTFSTDFEIVHPGNKIIVLYLFDKKLEQATKKT